MKWYDPKIKLLNHLWLSEQKREGFTLAEVLVAFLVVTLFVSFALQGMVLASLAQIRAREKAEASLVIQRNLEGIRVLAASYKPTGTDLTDRCNAKSSNEGLAAGLSAAIGSDENLKLSSTFKSTTVSNRDYPINRTLTPSTTNRNVLQITYSVTDSRTSNSLVQLSTEVIPDVAFTCP